MKSIGTKLALQIAIALTVLSLGTIVMSVNHQKKDNSVYLEEKEQRVIEQLTLILGSLLYEVNDTQIENVSRSYLTDPDILSIRVLGDDGRVVSYFGKKDETAEIINLSQEEIQDSQDSAQNPEKDVQNAEITYFNEVIGHIKLVFSRLIIRQQQEKTLLLGVQYLAGLILVEAIMVLILVRKNVTVPLSRLAQAARQIANGDVDLHLETTSSRNEIGVLSAAFGTMVNYIQSMAQAASRISTGDLRNQVEPRSERDVLGHAFQNMSAYLNEMAASATAISEGNFRRDIQPRSEYDILGNAFQQMKYLRESIQKIRKGSLLLNDASGKLKRISTKMVESTRQVSQQTQVVSSNSQQISENVRAVATATEEMSSNIREISTNTERVAQIADIAVKKAVSASKTMDKLEARSQEIGEIINVITAITQQTNLLALNATIEAARAGDFGKGFAVVANEIKELSRETASSTEDIINKLETIRAGSEDASKAMYDISETVSQIHDISSFIASGVEEQNSTTNEIANRMGEAAQGNQDITKVIGDVAEIALDTTTNATDVQHASEDLANLADQLQQLLVQFKI